MQRRTKYFSKFAPVIGSLVQLNRTSDSGSEGRRFESATGHKKSQSINIDWLFYFYCILIFVNSFINTKPDY